MEINGETMETVRDFILGSSKITTDGDCSHEIKRCLLLGGKAVTNLDSILKSRDITLPTKVHLVKAMVFPEVMYRCESWTIKESWAPKTWWFWTLVLENTLQNPLDYKKIQPILTKGNQYWIFTGIADAEAETPILWPPDAKNWLVWKDPDAGKDWRQEEKGRTVEKMIGWLHWLDGHECEQASRSWWWTGRPNVLQSMGSQWVGHYWVTELTDSGGFSIIIRAQKKKKNFLLLQRDIKKADKCKLWRECVILSLILRSHHPYNDERETSRG